MVSCQKDNELIGGDTMYQECKKRTAEQKKQTQNIEERNSNINLRSNYGYAFENVKKQLCLNSPVQLKQAAQQEVIQRYTITYQGTQHSFSTVDEYYKFRKLHMDADKEYGKGMDCLIKNILQVLPDARQLIRNIKIEGCETAKDVAYKIYNDIVKTYGIYTIFERIISSYIDWSVIEKNQKEKSAMNFYIKQLESIKESKYAPFLKKIITDYEKKLTGIVEQLHFAHYNEEREIVGDAIDPEDIKNTYNADRACVIVALFESEKQHGNNPFGAESSEDLHNILVHFFNRNKYSDDEEASDCQRNAVWKNYSDDHVYPSLYMNFGYKKQNMTQTVRVSSCQTVIKPEWQDGIMSIKGHNLFFYWSNNKIYYRDNSVMSGGELKNSIYREQKILEIWIKS